MSSLIIAAICSAILVLAFLQLAPKFGWVDQPDARKAHAVPVPALGGVAWFLSFAGVILYAQASPAHYYLLGAMALMVVVGAIDDRSPLPSWLRLCVQSLAVAIAFQGSGPITSLGETFGFQAVLGQFAWPFTIFAVIGVINAVNMIDGMDGLLGSLAMLALSALIFMQYRAGLGDVAFVPAVAVCAIIPFLLVNVRTPWQKQARMFFGDAGSMPIGLLLAWCVINATQGERAVMQPVSALYLLALPLIDTVSLMLRRGMRGQSPFKADQEHVHHLLQRVGFSVGASLLVLISSAFALLMLEWLMNTLGMPEYQRLLVFIAIAFGYHFRIGRVLRHKRWLGRDLQDSLVRLN